MQFHRLGPVDQSVGLGPGLQLIPATSIHVVASLYHVSASTSPNDVAVVVSESDAIGARGRRPPPAIPRPQTMRTRYGHLRPLRDDSCRDPICQRHAQPAADWSGGHIRKFSRPELPTNRRSESSTRNRFPLMGVRAEPHAGDYDETHNLSVKRSEISRGRNGPALREVGEGRDREIYAKAGELGFVGFNLPERSGGGSDDFRFNVVINEELQYAGLGGAGNGITLVNDILAPYFIELSTAEQRDRWLPGLASGELISAVAMTEPGTGSDLASIATRAVRDGDEYVVNGAKTFITNGINADLVVTVVRTDPDAGRHGLSLLVLERGMAGFDRGRNLDKIGQKSADTAELFFSDVRPRLQPSGRGRAMEYLTGNLPQERLSLAIGGVAKLKRRWTGRSSTSKTGPRRRPDRRLPEQFVLAECESELVAARPYMADCVARHTDGAFGGRCGEGQAVGDRTPGTDH